MRMGEGEQWPLSSSSWELSAWTPDPPVAGRGREQQGTRIPPAGGGSWRWLLQSATVRSNCSTFIRVGTAPSHYSFPDTDERQAGQPWLEMPAKAQGSRCSEGSGDGALGLCLPAKSSTCLPTYKSSPWCRSEPAPSWGCRSGGHLPHTGVPARVWYRNTSPWRDCVALGPHAHPCCGPPSGSSQEAGPGAGGMARESSHNLHSPEFKTQLLCFFRVRPPAQGAGKAVDSGSKT